MQRFYLFLCLLLVPLPLARAYWILQSTSLQNKRIDPNDSPGRTSEHVHAIVGGINFRDTYVYEEMRASGCSSVPVQEGKSGYWTPLLYHYNFTTGEFNAIDYYSNHYYLQRPGPANETIQAFPVGLQMVAGDPQRRTYNASNFADQPVSFVCLDSASHDGDPAWAERGDFFNHTCPGGLRAQVFFPSCWDGVNLFKEDGSHMSYPIQDYNSGDCPPTHPIHLISLFYEFIYDVGSWPFIEGQTNWVLSNGDTTGLSFHGDFETGWDPLLLQRAIDECTGEIGGNLEQCAPLWESVDVDKAKACKAVGQKVQEDVEGPMGKLPGDNLLWGGAGGANGTTTGTSTASSTASGAATLTSSASIASTSTTLAFMPPSSATIAPAPRRRHGRPHRLRH